MAPPHRSTRLRCMKTNNKLSNMNPDACYDWGIKVSLRYTAFWQIAVSEWRDSLTQNRRNISIFFCTDFFVAYLLSPKSLEYFDIFLRGFFRCIPGTSLAQNRWNISIFSCADFFVFRYFSARIFSLHTSSTQNRWNISIFFCADFRCMPIGHGMVHPVSIPYVPALVFAWSVFGRGVKLLNAFTTGNPTKLLRISIGRGFEALQGSSEEVSEKRVHLYSSSINSSTISLRCGTLKRQKQGS